MNRLQQTRRQKIGYQYKAQVNNNVGTVNYTRNPYYVQLKSFDQNMVGSGLADEQEGDGFIDIIKGIVSKGKQVGRIGSELSNAYSSEIGTSLRNILPNSDETARPGFPGEKHAILKLPNGKYGVGNYIGPGTHLVERLKRGDPPRT